MGTQVGVGHSICRNPAEAGKEAALMALQQAGGIKQPDLVIVFATVGYNQQALIGSIREATSRAPLCGCSGEGIITTDTINESNFAVAVMAIRSDELKFHNFSVSDINVSTVDAGARLAEQIKPQLADDSFACMLFADGLKFNFDPFLAMFENSLASKTLLPLFGGLAADNCSFRNTYQYCNDSVSSDSISGFLISGAGHIAWSINHGCVPVGTKHTITRSKGNTIYEIDGIPAIEALSGYLEDGWKEHWNKATLNLCLGFKSPEQLRQDYGDYFIRYLMCKDDRDGSVNIQSNVKEGMEFLIVRRDKDLICRGTQTLAQRLKEKLDGRKPQFILHFDCVGRGKVVFREQEKTDLVKSIQKNVGEDIPWLGFYTYGEIGPVAGKNCTHNFTAVLAAIY